MTKKRKTSQAGRKHRKPTVWEALNEPVIEVDESQALRIFLAAAAIMAMAWISPYWAAASEVADQQIAMGYEAYQSQVLGAQISADQPVSIVPAVPDWYIAASATTEAVHEAYATAANQILDVSAPVTDAAEFLQPGTDAVWLAWLQLIRDPGSPSF
jgi:hypothetical protein